MKSIALVILIAATAAACAATPVPADKYARARAAIRSAEVMKVDQSRTGALYLQQAHEAIDQANKSLKNGDNERARNLLIRAEADANAAVHMVRAERAKEDMTATLANVRELKAQLEVTP